MRSPSNGTELWRHQLAWMLWVRLPASRGLCSLIANSCQPLLMR